MSGKIIILVCVLENFDLVLVFHCLDIIELAFCQKTSMFAPFSWPFILGFSFFVALSMASSKPLPII